VDEALEVLERIAKEKNCPFVLVGKDVKFERINSSLEGQEIAISFQHSVGSFEIPLLGSHQVENAASAYTALKTSGLGISDEAIQKGLAEVKWPARFQVVRRDPPVILDSAHNQDSFAKLRQTLEEHFPGKQVYLIFGASEDKNIPGMFAEMKPKIKRLIVTRADHPRALEPGKIIELANQAGLESEAVIPVESALGRALKLSEKDGSIVLSAGSMFVTAEVMRAWKKPQMSLRGA
jgi:dihydrofolate synthase / folylpolyglutamate synthase